MQLGVHLSAKPSLDIFANDYATDWVCGTLRDGQGAQQDGGSDNSGLGGHRPGNGRGAVAAGALALA